MEVAVPVGEAGSITSVCKLASSKTVSRFETSCYIGTRALHIWRLNLMLRTGTAQAWRNDGVRRVRSGTSSRVRQSAVMNTASKLSSVRTNSEILPRSNKITLHTNLTQLLDQLMRFHTNLVTGPSILVYILIEKQKMHQNDTLLSCLVKLLPSAVSHYHLYPYYNNTDWS
jgi:hypothetical protein